MRAQNRNDKLYFYYEYSPKTNLRDTVGYSQLSQIYDIQIGVPPIQLGKRLKWINVVNIKTSNYSLEKLPEQYKKAVSTLFEGQYGMVFIYDFINPKWSVLVSPRFIIRSSLSAIEFEKSLFPSGILIINYNADARKRLVWSFGFAYANDFNKNVLIPIAGLSYQDEKFCIEVAYPRINFLYKPKPKIEWGITASAIGGIYHIPNLSLANNTIANYTRTVTVQAGHTFNYLFTKRLIINSCIGYSFIRNYDLMNDDFKPIDNAKLDLKQAIFIRTGLSFRI